MYLRESSRRNKDGSKVTYLQLAHNERHPVTGSPVAKVIHNFGGKDKVACITEGVAFRGGEPPTVVSGGTSAVTDFG